MGLVGRGQELLEQLADRLIVRRQPPLLHDHLFLGVEFAQDGIEKAVGLERHPQLDLVGGKVVEIDRLVVAGAGVHAGAAGLLDRLPELVGDDIGFGLGNGRLVRLLQLLQSGGIGQGAQGKFGAPRAVGLILFGHRLEFSLEVFGADGAGPLEGHVLKDVRDAGDALGFIDRADIGVGDERDHRRFVALEDEQAQAVVQGVLDHLVLQLQVALGPETGCGQEKHEEEHRFSHGFSPLVMRGLV